jgi:dipeptidyl aminopeptidase/acylaminoacyl peptidase
VGGGDRGGDDRRAEGVSDARLDRARRFVEAAVAELVHNVHPTPVWDADGDGLRYLRERPDAPSTWVHVDPGAATVTVDAPPPDPGAPADPASLPSPDGTHVLTLDRVGNLVLDGAALTDDAAPWLAYGTSPDTNTAPVTIRRAGQPAPPIALWSPDGRHVLTHRLDQRRVRELELLQATPDDGGPAPEIWRYRVPFPGDEHVGTVQLLVVDARTRTVVPVGRPLLAQFLSPLEQGWAWWSGDGADVWWLREERGARRLALCTAAAADGVEREVLAEEDPDGYVQPHELLPWPSQARTLGDEVLWLAEREDGWAHLYVHDARTGAQRRRLTAGAWTVRDVLHADVAGRFAIIAANGREAGRDPYLRHVYRVDLDDGALTLLTPEDGDHEAHVSPSGRWLVDTCSRIDTVPVTRLRSARDGALVLELETADVSALEALGWRPPEPFTATAADGTTPLYGALFLPSDFDPSREPDRRLPVVDDLYPGPQLIRTPKGFRIDGSVPDGWPGMWGPTATAELGVAVVCLDGRGTPRRGRDFRRVSHGRLQEAGELVDHVAVLEQLAAARPYLDLTRVAAVGHSGGGFAAARALLAHPETFHVGVAGDGVHDLRRYLAYWAEKYQGDDVAIADNAPLAPALRGALLLIHGELDDNVHPSASVRLLDALLQAGHRADLTIIPGQPHACAGHPEYLHASWTHLLRHLRP